MAETRPTVLIIGGSGVFGAHLCRRLARLGLYHISVGGRNRDNALSLLEELLAIDPECEARFVEADRNTVNAEELKWHGLAAVVDAAGPFQGSSLRLAEAAIEAGIHYIDLSDARDFAARVPALEAKAKSAGVAVLTGASSTPALSNAILRDLTAGWRSIDRIWVSIVPGSWSYLRLKPNAAAEPGRSVIEAILSWAGEPVRVFVDGRWQMQTGWSGYRKVRLGSLGWRRSSLAETPDLDLLVEEFKPRTSARFHAGLELGIMHNGLRLLAMLRSWRLLPKLTAFTGALHYGTRLIALNGISALIGTNTGGMVVEAEGIDGDGAAVRAEALLTATDGHGPVIPALCAVALLQKIAEGRLDFRGASHAGRLLQTEEVLALVPDLSIRLTSDSRRRGTALFPFVLDTTFETMPAATQSLHRGTPAVFGEGRADIEAPENFIGRFISALFRFPKPGKDVPVSVLVEQTPTGERWLRRYPGRDMLSVMSHADADAHSLEERFAPFSFRMSIKGHSEGLDMEMMSARLGPVPLPSFLTPKIIATERSDPEGRHGFDVLISLPLVGRIVRYTGWLAIK